MEKKFIGLTVILSLFLIMVVLTGCSENTDEIGIGPIKKYELKPVNTLMVEKGNQIFDEKCASCHKFNEKLVGPPLNGVTKRRKPEWILNMILNPEQMTKENPEAKKLFGEYLTQMTYQNVSQTDAEAILNYLRKNDGE